MNRKQQNHRPNPFRGGPSNQGSQQQQQQNDTKQEPLNQTFPRSPSNRSQQQYNNYQNNQNKPANYVNRSNITSSNNNVAPVQPQPLPKSGPCALCKATTVLICSRCNDFYCSPSCQKKDWPTHRFICFPMPKLVTSAVDVYQNVPTLSGFQNKELPETASLSPSIQSQNKKWVNSNSATPSHEQQNNQGQRQQNNSPKQQQQQQQPQNQQYQNLQQYKPIQQQQPQQQNQPQKQNQQQQIQRNQQQNPQQNQQQKPQQLQQQNQQPNSNQRPQRQAPSNITSNASEKSADLNDKSKASNVGRVEQVPFPKSKSNVLVTSVRSSNRVFLRSIEKAENEGYLEALKAINEYGRNAQPLKMMPMKNAFAITDFNNDGLFYRVQVISAKDENNIQVIYFDFGNEGTKKLSELKDITRECATLKQFVVMATLKNVPFLKDNPQLIEYMKKFEDTEATIVYNEKEKPSCEIIFNGCEESFNQMINNFIQKTKDEKEAKKPNSQVPMSIEPKEPPTTDTMKSSVSTVASVTSAPTLTNQQQKPKGRPSQFAKPVMNPPFEQCGLPMKAKNIDVMIVDNSLLHYNCFGCVLLEDKVNLQEIQNYLVDYKDSGREYKPKIEEYCLAKFHDGWYRAKVLDILSTEVVEVVFIDFLNESEVFIKDIRRYPMDLDFPCKTTLCLIEGLPNELTESQVEYLKKKLQPGTEIKISEVVEKHPDGSDIAVCKINQITQWMAEDKP